MLLEEGTGMYICNYCRRELFPGDRVVTAAEQVDVTTFSSEGPEYIDGLNVLFHEEHWPGDSIKYKERGRGEAQDFVSAE